MTDFVCRAVLLFVHSCVAQLERLEQEALSKVPVAAAPAAAPAPPKARMIF